MLTWQERTKGWLHDADNIKGFFGDYRWLSNFHSCPINYPGIVFASTEHAYQAAKCDNASDVRKFTGITASKAKFVGQKVKMREDWEQVKLEVMYDVCLLKFTQNEDLKAKLIATGDKYLEETNWWNDKFWGVCNGVGKNHLGKILMQIRKELK